MIENPPLSEQVTRNISQKTSFAPTEGMKTPEQIAIMRKVHKFGAELAASHPEVADLYRDMDRLLTYFDIAAEYIPELYSQNPMFASRIVGHAVRLLIPSEEQQQLTSQRRAEYLKRQIASMSEEDYKKHQENAARSRNLQYSSIEAMVRGRGQLPWGLEEKAMVIDLMVHDPEYQHSGGSQKGRPDYLKIADEINLIYHQGNPIRLSQNIGDMVRDERRKQKKRLQKS